VIVLVAPWAIAVTLATRGQFIAQAVGNDLVSKLIGGQEAHAAPPGIYLLSATATLWPGSMFVLPGLVRAIGSRAGPAIRFCLAWAIPAWILFEIVPTKLPHYVLPCVPALVLLAGVAVAAGDTIFRRGWVRAYALLCALVGVAVAVGAVGAPFLLGAGFAWPSIACAAAALVAGIASAWLLLRGQIAQAVGVSVVASLVTLAFLFGGVLPSLDKMWLAERVAQFVPAGAPAAATSFHEPSLVFALGTHTKLTDGPGAADFLLTTPHAVALVEAADEAGFQARLGVAKRDPRRLGEADGLNYSRGKPMHLTVWTLDVKP
jgi:4-amino-4-deoxy-L-arabinose transferase-like glycosyltransferase